MKVGPLQTSANVCKRLQSLAITGQKQRHKNTASRTKKDGLMAQPALAAADKVPGSVTWA
jgi:hypothetical protein